MCFSPVTKSVPLWPVPHSSVLNTCSFTGVQSTKTFKNSHGGMQKVDIVLSIQKMPVVYCLILQKIWRFCVFNVYFLCIIWALILSAGAHLRFLMTCKYTSTWIYYHSLAILRTIPLWFWSKISYNRKSHLYKENLLVLGQHTDSLESFKDTEQTLVLVC